VIGDRFSLAEGIIGFSLVFGVEALHYSGSVFKRNIHPRGKHCRPPPLGVSITEFDSDGCIPFQGVLQLPKKDVHFPERQVCTFLLVTVIVNFRPGSSAAGDFLTSTPIRRETVPFP